MHEQQGEREGEKEKWEGWKRGKGREDEVSGGRVEGREGVRGGREGREAEKVKSNL